MSSDELIDELQKANLRGRGGAGFPMGRKASLIDRKSAKPKYLVVNADESEPGAFKDREVMARVPHRLIEGCLIAAHAIESTDVFIYIRGEYLTEYEILAGAVEEAREAGIFGDVRITVHRGAGAYICGEETALLESLEGKRGQPRPRPPFPPIQGLYAAPTQINNVCTIATVPVILEEGAEAFAKTGAPSSPGTAIFSVSGNVVRPGNYELDLGTPMRELIYEHAGGIADGRELKAVIPGGSSVPALTPDQIDVPLDYDSLGAIGTFFGAASLIVRRRPVLHGAARHPLDEVLHARVVRQVHAVPGRDALDGADPRVDRGRHRDRRRPRAARLDVGDNILGKVPVRARRVRRLSRRQLPHKWRDEFGAHIEQGGCPFGGDSSSLEGILAPSDQHAHTTRRTEALV